MKILHLLDIPWWSGLSSYAFDILQANLSLGDEVKVACSEGTLPYYRCVRLNIDRVPLLGRQPPATLYNFYQIAATVRSWRPDWIIAHTGTMHWMAVRLGQKWDIPVIRTRATAQRLKQTFLNRKIYNNTQKIVVASQNLKEECLSLFKDDASSKVQVLYPPVDLPPQKSQISTVKKVGLVARLDPIKDLFTFIQSAKKISEKVPNVEFHIAGSEENLAWKDLLKESQRVGLQNLFYHGFLEECAVLEMMQNCDCGVLTSKGSEEVSRALLEWMACRKPVVATKVGCIPEILQEGEGGFLVEPQDSIGIAEKVSQILKNTETAQRMGDTNFSQIQKNYSRERFNLAWKRIWSGDE